MRWLKLIKNFRITNFKKSVMNSYLKIAIVIVAFVVGFFLGRKTIDVEEKIESKGETIP